MLREQGGSDSCLVSLGVRGHLAGGDRLRGVDMDTAEMGIRTALYFVTRCATRRRPAVDALVEAGVNIKATSSHGCTSRCLVSDTLALSECSI